MLRDEDLMQPLDRERGAILPLMAIVLVLLMGFAAMAVDLGWIFWNSIEIQHGADAAALAGVVYEPDQRTQAYAEAQASASGNGYVDGVDGATVTVVDFTEDDTAVVNESMLRVTITKSVPMFFLPVFGIDTLNVSRTAVAEYVQPLALGSPESYFGNDPARGITAPGFVGQINGSYVAKEGGDRFASLCLHDGFGVECRSEKEGGAPASGGSPRGLNPEGRVSTGPGSSGAQGGYLFGIEVEEGSSAGLSVEIFSAPLYAIRENQTPPAGTGTGNFHGDSKYRPEDRNVNARTWFMLYGPDPTPADTTDGNELLCSVAYDERLPTEGLDEDTPPNSSAYLADFESMVWDTSWLEFDQVPQAILNAMWENMSSPAYADVGGGCSGSFDRGPGVYVLRVFNQHDTSGAADITQSWRGSNKFSLRASSSGTTQPTVYAIQDMVMTAARNTSQTEFFLARVEERYAGKDLIIELWDVGDIFDTPGGDSFSILDGTATTVNCEWTATNTSPSPIGNPNPTSGALGPCSINASNKQFNDELITMTVKIPEDYTCNGDECWWKIRYSYAGTVKDTTTWTAYIDGNPIRIVE